MKVAIVHDFLVRYGWAEKILECFLEIFPNAKIYTLFYDEKKMWKFFPKEKVFISSLQKYYKLFFETIQYFFQKYQMQLKNLILVIMS